jgi:ATP-dependent DNA ligase
MMDKEVRLLYRNRRLLNDNYPQLVDALKSLKARNFIVDGEIPALNEQGIGNVESDSLRSIRTFFQKLR